jgi:hypothetical protein
LYESINPWQKTGNYVEEEGESAEKEGLDAILEIKITLINLRIEL